MPKEGIVGIPHAYIIAHRTLARAKVPPLDPDSKLVEHAFSEVTKLVKDLTIGERESIVRYVQSLRNRSDCAPWQLYKQTTKTWFRSHRRRHERHHRRTPESQFGRQMFALRICAALFLHALLLQATR